MAQLIERVKITNNKILILALKTSEKVGLSLTLLRCACNKEYFILSGKSGSWCCFPNPKIPICLVNTIGKMQRDIYNRVLSIVENSDDSLEHLYCFRRSHSMVVAGKRQADFWWLLRDGIGYQRRIQILCQLESN